jgi:hypothetical protein
MSTDSAFWLVPRDGDRLLHVSPDGPLTSLAQARDALRALAPAEREAQPIRVLIHDGDYALDEPFILGPEDSGTAAAPIIYQAAPGQAPRLGGGRRLRGWTPVEHKGQAAWKLEIPEVKSGAWWFTQLFVEGERRPRARLPREGYFHFREAGMDRRVAGYHPGDLRPWHNLPDVVVNVLHYWVDSHLAIAELDETTHTVTFDRDASMSLLDEKKAGSARYFVENVLEGLEAPGQWYLDRPAGALYYLPLPGEDPERTRIVAPVLEQLVLFSGEPGRPVHDVHLAGLHLQHTEWNYPADIGGSNQAAWRVPGAIALVHARDCSLRCNEIAHLGNYAVEIGEDCRGIAVVANRLHDLGAGGVKLGSACAPEEDFTGRESHFSFVSDNSITEGGRRYPSGVGIWIGHSGDNVVTYNHIADFFYTGISVGWIWGYTASQARRNLIAHNHIHTIGQGVLSDMGGIYSLGVSPGTRICHNHIHDVRCYGYGGNGIYPDEATSFVLYEDNVVHDTDSAPLYTNGRDDLFRNNIFACGRDAQLWWGKPKYLSPFRAEHNLVYWRTGAIVRGVAFDGLRQVEFDHNLYWQAEGQVGDFASRSWSEWQARGLDVHGVIADPLFADPEHGDFTLRADSPALALGFRPIDLTDMGPRPEVLRTGEAPEPSREIGPCVWTQLLPVTETELTLDQVFFAYPETAPCAFTLRAIFENAGDKPFHGPMTVRAFPEEALAGPATLTQELNLEPGQEIEIPLDLSVREGTEEFVVEAVSEAGGFWGSSLSFAFRPEIPVRRLPEGIAAGELSRALAESPARPVRRGSHLLGTFRLGVSGDRLALLAEVNDSCLEITEPVYFGSMIDLWGKHDAADTGFAQVFLVPSQGETPARMLTNQMVPVEGGEVCCTPTPTGYEMAALIPLSALNLEVVNGELALTAAIYTHLEGLTGVQRVHLVNERELTDIHAYPRLVLV